jgi:hypothetical protein
MHAPPAARHLALMWLLMSKNGCTPAGNCSTYHCFKGGPAEPPRGLASPGCPLASHPAELADNRNCVLCMECDKARLRWRSPMQMLRVQFSTSRQQQAFQVVGTGYWLGVASLD